MAIEKRVPMREQDPKVRITNFDSVPLGYSAEEAVKEAKRCIQCKVPLCETGCPVRMDIKDIIVTIRPALLATLVAGTAGLAFKHLLNLEISIWIETIISGLMMMTVYLIITLGFYGKRDFLIDFFKEVFHQGQSAST